MFTIFNILILPLFRPVFKNGFASISVMQMQAGENAYIYVGIAILSLIAVGIAASIALKKYIGSSKLKKIFEGNTAGNTAVNSTGEDTVDKLVTAAGYSYDAKQDIFYSNMDAWQRDMGYCRLFDEASAPLGMIIDCEPVRFEYEGKKWLVELWKGQYDLTTGCEVGVYTSDGPDINIPSVFEGPFYKSAGDNDQLMISYTLRKNNKTMFTRKGRHWWLTGFKLGEFSEPSQLTMNVNITLKSEKMCSAFVNGLKAAGYSRFEFIVYGSTVSLNFDKPRTQQPVTRVPETDWIIQRKNKFMCDRYQEITKSYKTMPDKIKAVKEHAPELYEKVINIGKTRQLFSRYESIKKYLN